MSTIYNLEEGALLCGFSTSDRSDPNNPEAIKRAVQELVPDAEVIAVDAHDWNNDEFAQGTWMAYRPGQVMDHSGKIQKPYNRIVFAGSEQPPDGRDEIDGAIESGRRAAQDVGKLLSTDC